MLLEKMERQQPNSHHERRGLTLRPVLRVQMPSSPDERRFYTRLLEVLGAPYTSHDQIGALEGRVLHILAEIGTKLLCIDEVHHLLAGSQREQRRALSLLKFVANELKIAVVAVGTQDAFHAMQIDSQVASRFEPLLLPRWTEIDGFRGFVTGYGRPVCPPPHGDESLHSWFERVAAYYGLSPHRMLSTVARGLPKPRDWSDAFKVGIALAANRKVARRLIALSGLSPSAVENALAGVRPRRRDWRSYAMVLKYSHLCPDNLAEAANLVTRKGHTARGKPRPRGRH